MPVFIDEKGFSLLMQGAQGMAEFWRHRAELIKNHLLKAINIEL